MGLSKELGTLGSLPREVRDRIYTYALCFNFSPGDPELKGARHGAALLRASRSIHNEAIVILYQVNQFTIWIDQQYHCPINYSIMGCPGFKISFTHGMVDGPPCCHDCISIPKNMLRHLQNVSVEIGVHAGINEVDVVPTTGQTLSGPQRPTFHTVIDRSEEAFRLLNNCDKIHRLVVSVFCNELDPMSVEKALEPITRLRGVRYSVCGIYPSRPTMTGAYRFKDSYVVYLRKIMSMPASAKAPMYAPYKSEGQKENGIYLFEEDDPSDSASDDYYDYAADQMVNYYDDLSGVDEASYWDAMERMSQMPNMGIIDSDDDYMGDLVPPDLYHMAMSNGNPPSGDYAIDPYEHGVD